jgi:hypothetical protein
MARPNHRESRPTKQKTKTKTKMKTTNQNQNSATSPRSKRRGLIQLALLCLLSVFMAPIQSFAQQVPTVNPGNGNLPELMQLKVMSTAKINTRWTDVQSLPSQVKNGHFVTLTGQLVFEKSRGLWLPLSNKNVTVQVGRGRIIEGRTNNVGVVKFSVRIMDPSPIPKNGKRVSFRFTYGGDGVFRLSFGQGMIVVMP